MKHAWQKLIGNQAIKACRIFFSLFLLFATALSAQETFPSLEIGSQTYSNVIVTGKNGSTVFIQHDKGIATLKVKELSPELAQALGYEVEPPPRRPMDFARDIQIDPRVYEFKEQAEQEIQAALQRFSQEELGLVLACVFLIYLFFCLCCHRICVKAGHKPGLLIWLPVLKTFPLLRAAGMSGWCFFLLLIPIINVIVVIVWCVKICNARQKSPLLAVFLLLPVTNVLSFLYLAFSSGIEVPETPRKFRFS